jgi:hypothetical protein
LLNGFVSIRRISSVNGHRDYFYHECSRAKVKCWNREGHQAD